MGQRLNIEIVNEKGVIANCYYHWSAYTDSAAELTKKIIQSHEDQPKDIDWEAKAFLLLQSTGAGIIPHETASDRLRIQLERLGLSPKVASSRNAGLISFEQGNIEDTRSWEEGRVTINIESEEVDFSVFIELKEGDEYEGYKMTDQRLKINSIPFSDFEVFSQKLHDVSCDEIFQDEHGNKIIKIE